MLAVSEIKKEVRKILDYNLTTVDVENLTDDIGQLDLDEAIKGEIEAAARLVLLNAPAELLDWTRVEVADTDPVNFTIERKDGDTTTAIDDSKATELLAKLEMPEGMLRFGVCKMASWKKPVFMLASTDSKEYYNQYGEFTGLMATALKPVAALILGAKHVRSDNTEKYADILEMYGVSGSTDTLDYCSVVVAPQLVEVTEANLEAMKAALGSDTNPSIGDYCIAVGDKLREPLWYMTAALVCEVLKDGDKATNMKSLAMALMTSKEETETKGQNV